MKWVVITTTIAPVQLFLFLHIIWFTQVREVLHIYLMSLQGACECRYPTGKKQSLDEESSCIQFWSDQIRRVGSMSCQCYSNLLCSALHDLISKYVLTLSIMCRVHVLTKISTVSRTETASLYVASVSDTGTKKKTRVRIEGAVCLLPISVYPSQ